MVDFEADHLLTELNRATVLMNDLLDNPEGFYNHVRRYTASVASILTYGQRGPTFESFWAHGVYDVMDRVGIYTFSVDQKLTSHWCSGLELWRLVQIHL